MSAGHSVRLTLRRGQHLDLHIEKITEGYCRLEIDPHPGCDNNIVVRLSVESRGEPADAESDVDDTIQRSASAEDIGKGNWNGVGVGNQSGFGLNSPFFGHAVPQSSGDLNRQRLPAGASMIGGNAGVES